MVLLSGHRIRRQDILLPLCHLKMASLRCMGSICRWFCRQDTIVNTTDAGQANGTGTGARMVLYTSAIHEKEKYGGLFYKGDKAKFGTAQLAAMEKRKTRVHT